MTSKQRELFAEKFADLGNYSVTGMVLAQIVLGLSC